MSSWELKISLQVPLDRCGLIFVNQYVAWELGLEEHPGEEGAYIDPEPDRTYQDLVAAYKQRCCSYDRRRRYYDPFNERGFFDDEAIEAAEALVIRRQGGIAYRENTFHIKCTEDYHDGNFRLYLYYLLKDDESWRSGNDYDDDNYARLLTEAEKEEYRPIFQSILPNVNMDDVHCCRVCFYNGSDEHDVYDKLKP